jgi:hypothetical protein
MAMFLSMNIEEKRKGKFDLEATLDRYDRIVKPPSEYEEEERLIWRIACITGMHPEIFINILLKYFGDFFNRKNNDFNSFKKIWNQQKFAKKLRERLPYICDRQALIEISYRLLTLLTGQDKGQEQSGQPSSSDGKGSKDDNKYDGQGEDKGQVENGKGPEQGLTKGNH